MKLEQVDRKKLLPLLTELTAAVEDLIATGLTTASESTLKTLNVTFQETSRMGLLRLGSTIRSVNDEVMRYTKNDKDFSRKRLSFFLNRSWMLSHALRKAIEQNDAVQFEKLMRTLSPTPIEKLEVVTFGVVKKVATSFVSFEFRLRAIADSAHIKKGEKMLWSTMFPVKPGSDVPAEGYLHLPQKQKFNGIVFLEPKIITIENANTTLDITGAQRITLTDTSTVVTGEEFQDWSTYFTWDRQHAFERVDTHEIGPFDLEVELQEEVFLENWEMADSWEADDSRAVVFPIWNDTLMCEATITDGPDQTLLKDEIEKLKKVKKKPMLYGLMHYEKCKFVLQPLTIFEKDKPKHLMISDKKIDRAALLKTLSF